MQRLLSALPLHLRAAAVAGAGLSLNLGLGGDGDGSSVEACGIVGVVGKPTGKDDARGFLLEGLQVLRNRGYDSAGLATKGTDHGAAAGSSVQGSQSMVVTKYASRGDSADSIDLLRAESTAHLGHGVGIAHTRWATHGGKTDENAHPHVDMEGRVAIVHNGVINNAHSLRKDLQKQGVVFTSETDSEVIAQLIGRHLAAAEAQGRAMSVKEATARALQQCDGTWGLAVMAASSAATGQQTATALGAEEELVVACNGSPMTIGLGADRTFVASEPAAFNKYTKNFISMQDGEIGVVRADGADGLDLDRVEVAPEMEIQGSPDPHPHWTIKECLEQPQAIARALAFGGRLGGDKVHLGGLDRNREKMAAIKNLVLCGCGTSLHASLYGAKLMREYDAFATVATLDAAELRLYDLPRTQGGVLAVSQSGETKDVHRAVNAALKSGLPAVSIVNSVGSLIARTTQMGVYCHAGRENAVASTKAFTTQVTVLALVTVWFRQLRDSLTGDALSGGKGIGGAHESLQPLMDALLRLPISFGMANRLRPQCQEVAKSLLGKEHLFVLGKGYGEPIAYEGALKIKECAYLHAEGYSGGALKHGPFALIESAETGKFGATPIVMLILNDEFGSQMRTAAEEVKARGAQLIVITDDKALCDGLGAAHTLVIPNNGPLTALTAVLPLQLIAYELAVLKGLNPDVPRNLAKAVTVD